MSALFVLSVAIFFVAIIKQLLETNAFLKHLEAEYPQLFQSLGRPKWGIQFGDRAFRDSVKKIRSHHFASLQDEKLEQIYRSIKSSDKMAIISAIFALGVTVADVIKLS